MKKKYIYLEEKHSIAYLKLNRQYNFISALRLFVASFFLISLYYYIERNNSILLSCLILGFILFIVLMNIHQKISWKRKIRKHLIEINKNELSYLKGESVPFADGIEFSNPSHLYSYDLDIFGKGSLFQNLNRTATRIGKIKLSEQLLSLLSNKEIKLNQEAIKELSEKIDWRQKLLALSKIANDNKENYDKLIKWSLEKESNPSILLLIISYASPIVLIGSLVLFSLTTNSIFGYIATGLFLLNLLLIFIQAKKISQEIIDSEKIHEAIKQYSLIIEVIEKENFESKKLKSIKNKLKHKTGYASKQVRLLSYLFANMDNIHNLMARIILNGFFLFHIHVLRKLLYWKKQYSKHIPIWLDVIGEFETFNSISNFSFNNPKFTFPILNNDYNIVFHDLGHPLIKAEKRISNTVEFNTHKFIILTGSNMSGKSTFLRSLGINMVLAGIGSPICASYAKVHPLNVLVSMRLSDSLNDNESYFFAEIKRLKEITITLDSRICFVLLDEILQGTNSDDKRNGTIEVIKKIIEKKAIGAIATHDLEICSTKDQYSDILTNKYFESEIKNGELSFDYRLKNGICKNKNALFLMKKMKIV